MADDRPYPDLPPLPLTPSAFIEMVAACLDRLHGADAAPVRGRQRRRAVCFGRLRRNGAT